jgi:hypothetical protein
VSTTIDSSTIPTPTDTVSASIHFVCLVSIRKITTPNPKSIQSQESRPLPIIGISLRK